MLIAALSFVVYAIGFFFINFYGSGFEIGVETLNGMTKAELSNINPTVVAYISHLHIATSGFIAATGIAVAALSWYGVRRGKWWAWYTAVASTIVGLIVALPMHYLNLFKVNWVLHLGPVYLSTIVFAIGALFSLKGFLIKKD